LLVRLPYLPFPGNCEGRGRFRAALGNPNRFQHERNNQLNWIFTNTKFFIEKITHD
jgi:hypothetical protein